MKNKKSLNKESDFIDSMNRQNKVFIGVLGGATLGFMFISLKIITDRLSPVLHNYLTLIHLVAIIVGGVIGYFIGKRV